MHAKRKTIMERNSSFVEDLYGHHSLFGLSNKPKVQTIKRAKEIDNSQNHVDGPEDESVLASESGDEVNESQLASDSGASEN